MSAELPPDQINAPLLEPGTAEDPDAHSVANQDGNTLQLEVTPDSVPGAPAGEAPAASPAQEIDSSYMNESREAFRGAQEHGRKFLSRVGRSAISPFVRFRRGGRGEATSPTAPDAETVNQTRVQWRDRAGLARQSVMNRLERRWEQRQEVRNTAREARIDERVTRNRERIEHKRRDKLDQAADQLDNRIHKAQMSRKEYNQYKYNKQAKKDRERDDKMWADWKEQKEAKARAKRVKGYVREYEKGQKQVAKRHKSMAKEAPKLQQRHEKVTALEAEAKRIAELRADPVAHARYLKEQHDKKVATRKARVQRVGTAATKAAHGINVASKVAVGAGVVGGELATKHAKGMKEAAQHDERLQYAKYRAKLGLLALRGNIGAMLSTASEVITPSTSELNQVADTGTLEIAPNVEVEIKIDRGDDHDTKELVDA